MKMNLNRLFVALAGLVATVKGARAASARRAEFARVCRLVGRHGQPEEHMEAILVLWLHRMHDDRFTPPAWLRQHKAWRGAQS